MLLLTGFHDILEGPTFARTFSPSYQKPPSNNDVDPSSFAEDAVIEGDKADRLLVCLLKPRDRLLEWLIEDGLTIVALSLARGGSNAPSISDRSEFKRLCFDMTKSAQCTVNDARRLPAS